MLFIYTPHDSPRIDYTLNFIFGDCLKTPVSLVDDLREVPGGAPLLVYSYVRPEQAAIWLFPHDLALGFSIESQKLGVFQYNGHPVFFGIEEGLGADLPYDPIALIFFMLSRYEEYITQDRDDHGRFPAAASVAHRHGFLEHPVVDQAVEDIRQVLGTKWPQLQMQENSTEIEITYDIDAPYAYYGKPAWKNLAAGILELLTFRGARRLKYLFGGMKDPFDIFDGLLEQLDDAGIRARFFLLMENKGRNNPMIDPKDDKYRALVSKLADAHGLGIHPSYNCSDNASVGREIDRFKAVSGEAPMHSRFHFIRMQVPASYHLIYGNGLFHDHSMAFPDHCGFRAGTTRTFRFYDLSAEVETDLEVHPFCFMDATFEYYMSELGEAGIIQRIREIIGRIRAVNGRISWVFHNDLLSGRRSAFNWAEIHKMALNERI